MGNRGFFRSSNGDMLDAELVLEIARCCQEYGRRADDGMGGGLRGAFAKSSRSSRGVSSSSSSGRGTKGIAKSTTPISVPARVFWGSCTTELKVVPMAVTVKRRAPDILSTRLIPVSFSAFEFDCSSSRSTTATAFSSSMTLG